MLILIACHLGFVRHNLQHLMTKSGNKVLSASTQKRAQEVLAANPNIDVVITEWKIRGGSALELQRFARKIDRLSDDETNSKLPEFIILITPNADLDEENFRTEADIARDFGFRHVFEKPFDRGELLAAIRTIGEAAKTPPSMAER